MTKIYYPTKPLLYTLFSYPTRQGPSLQLVHLAITCTFPTKPLTLHMSSGQNMQPGKLCYIERSLHALWVKHSRGCIIGYFMLLQGIAQYCRVLSGHWAGCIIGRQFRQLALPQARKEKTRPPPLKSHSSCFYLTLTFRDTLFTLYQCFHPCAPFVHLASKYLRQRYKFWFYVKFVRTSLCAGRAKRPRWRR